MRRVQGGGEGGVNMGKGSATERRESALTASDQKMLTEVLMRREESHASPSRDQFRSAKIGGGVNDSVKHVDHLSGGGVSAEVQLSSQRHRSSMARIKNLMAGRGLVSAFGKKGEDGAQLRRDSPDRRTSSLRGRGSVSHQPGWMDFQMSGQEYSQNLRGSSRSPSRRREHVVFATDEPSSGHPQFGHERGSVMRPSIQEIRSKSRSPVTARPLVSKTATEERKRRGREAEDRDRRRGTVVDVPVDPKEWLLQSLRLQDFELQELFDQMEGVPEMNTYDISGVRGSWNELDRRRLDLAPEVGLLVKDQALLDKVKNLLTRFIEVQEAQMSKEGLGEADDGEGAAESRAKSPALFEGFERNQEGNLLPVFSKGTRLCSLCGQVRTKKSIQDSEFSGTPLLDQPPPSSRALPSYIPIEDYVIRQSTAQPVGHEKEYKSVYSSLEKRWYTVLFPALQPGKREDVQLLGEWLQRALHNKKCHDKDGHVVDINVSFLIHSIAFLEVVRQVNLECEERGDMLLHLWRQMLRIFNQVMASVEPRVVSVSAELVRLKEVMDLSKVQLSDLTREHHACLLKFKTVSDKLKQVNLQFTRLQRCRLCLAENLTPNARETFFRRETIKRFGTLAESAILQEEPDSAEQLTQETPGERGEGGGEVAPSELGVKGGTGEVDERNVSDSGAVGAPAPEAGAMGQDPPATAVASPGELIPGSPTFRIFKRISQGLVHDDGLHSDVPAQTDDPAMKHPFWKVLDRPKSAPARLNTYGMEIFEPLSAIDAAAFKKLKRARRLEYEELRRKGKVVENVVEGGVQENEASIKELADETMQLLAKVGINSKMASRFKRILAKLRLLQLGKLSADNWLEDLDLENTDMSFLDQLLGQKGKRSLWGKASRRGRGSSQFAQIADELMARRGSGRGSDVGLKPLKAKDLPFVPMGFAKMMKITPPKVVKSFNERKLLKLVEAIYTSKITADAVDDAVDNERQTACEFIYDFMLNIYGLKGMAESAVHGVFKKIKKMMISKSIDKCHKIRLFQRFCGFDPARGYAEPDLYMYLKVLARGQSRQGVLYAEQDDGIVFLNCAQSDYLLDEPTVVDHFNGDRDAAAEFINKFVGLHATTERTTPELQKILKSTQVKRVDFDHLMESVIDFNPTREDRAVRERTAKKIEPLTGEEETALENLFIAGDANQDGVLTFSEFREIISSADPSISEVVALRMFRETLVLMPDGGDSISPKAFATVAHAHGINAPSGVIFHLLKKTWDQIQGDINIEKMTEEAKEEAADLRVKLEELLASTSNDVSESVSTFRDFVLRFCGGQEGAEEKPADAESDESE